MKIETIPPVNPVRVDSGGAMGAQVVTLLALCDHRSRIKTGNCTSSNKGRKVHMARIWASSMTPQCCLVGGGTTCRCVTPSTCFRGMESVTPGEANMKSHLSQSCDRVVFFKSLQKVIRDVICSRMLIVFKPFCFWN